MITETYERDEVKQMFEEEGISVSEWAQRQGFRREDVYAVLNGRLKGKRGVGHRIAIALRLKRPTKGDNPIFQELNQNSK